MVASVADRLAARATQTFADDPWQRADARLSPVFNSPTGLDPSVQRLLRYGLTLILARRLEARRACERAEAPIPSFLCPHPLEEISKTRFYPQAAWAFTPSETRRVLLRELDLTAAALERLPLPQIGQSWQTWHQACLRWEALLAQQYQRIACLYASLARRFMPAQTQRELVWLLDKLLPVGASTPGAS